MACKRDEIFNIIYYFNRLYKSLKCPKKLLKSKARDFSSINDLKHPVNH